MLYFTVIEANTGETSEDEDTKKIIIAVVVSVFVVIIIIIVVVTLVILKRKGRFQKSPTKSSKGGHINPIMTPK